MGWFSKRGRDRAQKPGDATRTDEPQTQSPRGAPAETPAESETPLAKALEALRHELALAWQNSQGQRIRFRASEVTLTVETVLRSDKEVSAGVRWYVLQAGGGVTSGRETTQTIVLTLTPGLYDEQGRPSPLDVAADQIEPGK